MRRLPYTQPRRLGISTETIGMVQNALHEAATTPPGTSYPVFGHYPVQVAGKTGTAQVFGQGDYAWYCSYAPANDPKYVVVVMIQQGGHGGVTAAPAARMIYDSLFHVKGAPGRPAPCTATDGAMDLRTYLRHLDYLLLAAAGRAAGLRRDHDLLRDAVTTR